jgi:hypothetical protein
MAGAAARPTVLLLNLSEAFTSEGLSDKFQISLTNLDRRLNSSEAHAKINAL